MKKLFKGCVAGALVLIMLMASMVAYAGGSELLIGYGDKQYWVNAGFYQYSMLYSLEHNGEYFTGTYDDIMKNRPLSYHIYLELEDEFPNAVVIPNKCENDGNIVAVNIKYYDFLDNVNTFVLENGIRYLYLSLNQFSNLKTVVLPDSVKYITVNGEPQTAPVFYVKPGSEAEKYLIENGYNAKHYVSVNYAGAEILSDQPATIVEGRTLLPLRACLEALGASVEWDDASKTVTSQKGNTKISLTIGSDQLYVNGSAKTLDVPAQIMSGRTMVPVRAIAEAYQCKVEWDGTTNSVHIQ